jgi:osmoprotectant transport system ATP-binding protein
MMSRRDVNSLIIINDDDTYAGTVSIEKIREQGKAGREIGELITTDTITIDRKMPAREVFELLLSSMAAYIVVLNDDRTVAGLVTRTSMAKAMGEALWGELPS